MLKPSLTAIVAAAAMALSLPAMAHPEDEDGSYSRGPSASDLARAAVGKLVTQKKLPESWNRAVVNRLDVRTLNGSDRYVVTFENGSAAPAQRKLYVIMSTTGEFISAGFKPV